MSWPDSAEFGKIARLVRTLLVFAFLPGISESSDSKLQNLEFSNLSLLWPVRSKISEEFGSTEKLVKPLNLNIVKEAVQVLHSPTFGRLNISK